MYESVSIVGMKPIVDYPLRIRRRHCERSEAISSRRPILSMAGDCFVATLLAMTKGGYGCRGDNRRPDPGSRSATPETREPGSTPEWRKIGSASVRKRGCQ